MSLPFAHPSPVAQSITRANMAIRGAWIAAFAAVVWIAFGLESIIRPAQDDRRDAVWILPFALTTLTFWFIHRVQRSPDQPAERLAFAWLMIASGLVFLGNVGLILDQPILAMFASPWGALLWALGMFAFGWATWMAKILPRYAALSILLLEPGSVLCGLILSPMAPLYYGATLLSWRLQRRPRKRTRRRPHRRRPRFQAIYFVISSTSIRATSAISSAPALFGP